MRYNKRTQRETNVPAFNVHAAQLLVARSVVAEDAEDLEQCATQIRYRSVHGHRRNARAHATDPQMNPALVLALTHTRLSCLTLQLIISDVIHKGFWGKDLLFKRAGRRLRAPGSGRSPDGRETTGRAGIPVRGVAR